MHKYWLILWAGRQYSFNKTKDLKIHKHHLFISCNRSIHLLIFTPYLKLLIPSVYRILIYFPIYPSIHISTYPCTYHHLLQLYIYLSFTIYFFHTSICFLINRHLIHLYTYFQIDRLTDMSRAFKESYLVDSSL